MKEKDVWIAINALRDKIDTLSNTLSKQLFLNQLTMQNENVNPVFGPILEGISGIHSANTDQEIDQDPFLRATGICRNLLIQKQVLLDGYNELIRLLEIPGNIDKQTLMQSIGRTLKKASE